MKRNAPKGEEPVLRLHQNVCHSESSCFIFYKSNNNSVQPSSILSLTNPVLGTKRGFWTRPKCTSIFCPRQGRAKQPPQACVTLTGVLTPVEVTVPWRTHQSPRKCLSWSNPVPYKRNEKMKTRKCLVSLVSLYADTSQIIGGFISAASQGRNGSVRKHNYKASSQDIK